MDDVERIERRVKLHDVRVLLSVVETGSMHKAAVRLATSQPAVSRAIGDLERALGVRLLDRSPRGVVPTRYGRAIVQRGLAMFDELQQGVKDIAFLADPTAGELRIGCTESVAAGPVLAVIDQLTRQHPRIVFDVITDSVPALCRDLAERKIELAILRIPASPVGGDMVIKKLFDDPYVVVAARHSPWTRRRSVELAELVDERWTLPSPDSAVGAFARGAFRSQGLEPPATTVVTLSMHMRNRLLATGRFVTIMSSFNLLLPDKHPSLKVLPVKLTDACGTVAIITLKNRTLSPLAELFVKVAHSVATPLRKPR